MTNSFNDRHQRTSQRSIGELISSIKNEITGVVQREVAIAKKEFTDIAVKAGTTLALAAVLLFFLLSAWVMLLFAGAWGLVTLGLPHWGAFLIMTGILVLLAIVFGIIAFIVAKKIRAPEVTIDTATSAVAAVQGQRTSTSASYDEAFEELYGKQIADS